MLSFPYLVKECKPKGLLEGRKGSDIEEVGNGVLRLILFLVDRLFGKLSYFAECLGKKAPSSRGWALAAYLLAGSVPGVICFGILTSAGVGFGTWVGLALSLAAGLAWWPLFTLFAFFFFVITLNMSVDIVVKANEKGWGWLLVPLTLVLLPIQLVAGIFWMPLGWMWPTIGTIIEG